MTRTRPLRLRSSIDRFLARTLIEEAILLTTRLTQKQAALATLSDLPADHDAVIDAIWNAEDPGDALRALIAARSDAQAEGVAP